MKTGMIKKVAALDKVVQICNAHGTNYTPSNAALQPTALAALLQLAQEKSKAVIAANTTYTLAVNARSEILERIGPLATQVVRMVAASEATQKDKEDVALIKARFYHHTSRKRKIKAQGITDNAEQLSSPSRSTSRRDRDSMIDSFQRLIELLQVIAAYKPNEPNLRLEGLKAKLAELHALNLACMQAHIALSNARIEMNNLMNGPNGILETIYFAKQYIRAKFGMLSKQTEQLKAITNYKW